MSLSKKVLLYTFSTTLLIGVLIISYFSFMLPGLYENYKINQYFKHIQIAQENIMSNTSCTADTQTDAMNSLSFKIPKEGFVLNICNPSFSATITIEDDTIRSLIQKIRNQSNDFDSTDTYETIFSDFDFSVFEKIIEEINLDQMITIQEFELINSFKMENTAIQDYQIHSDFFISSAQVHDQRNTYINFIAIGEKDNELYISMGSAMAPKLEELSAIITQSIPMISVVLLLISMIFARYFTKQLASPIETLAQQAKQWNVKKQTIFHQGNQNDEFKTLENSLNQMQEDISTMTKQLEFSNQQLQQEKDRQQVFMMNASHHLKTPLTSASLLVESMLNKVGKFKDTDYYLPKVREELTQMQHLLLNILNAFKQKTAQDTHSAFDFKVLVENTLQRYETHILSKNFQMVIHLQSTPIESDSEILATIVDNFISNAMNYTPASGTIEIHLKDYCLTLLTHQTFIPETLLAHIREPFTRDEAKNHNGSGLGLYLVDVMSPLIHCSWDIENTQQGVLVTFYLKENL